MPILKVQTAQNVQINYEAGSVGLRLLAGILDLLTVILYVFLVQFVLITILAIDLFESDPGILVFIIMIIPPMLYLPVSEYFWNGRSVGKFLLKLKVVRTDGTAPSLGDYILRWLLRIIDVKLGFLLIFFIPKNPGSDVEQTFMIWVMILMLIPFPLVGVISMILSKTNQRVGDRVANTVVIRKKKLYSLDDTILRTSEKEYEPVYKNVLNLRDKDIYILKDAVENIDKKKNYDYVNKLADKAKTILEIDSDQRPLELIKTLLRDYDYLAKKRDMVDDK